jgi:hypothetical protein
MHSVFVNIILFITHLLTVVTKKNAVDLHSMSTQSLNTHHYSRGKTIRPVKNTGLYQWMTFVPLVTLRCFTYNKHKVTMMHSSNHKEHNRKKKNCIISHAQNTTALQSHLFLTGLHWLLVTNKGTVRFVWRQKLPRSTANCSVNFIRGITLTRTATTPIYSCANFK